MNGMFGFDPFYSEPFVEAPAVGAGAFGFVGALLGVFIMLYFAIFAFGVVCYILQSIGLYTVAKRRGIHNPWLAWLPVGVLWILGSISDQYQYVVKGRVRNRRKTLLGLSIAMVAAVFVEIVSLVAMVVAAVIGDSAATASAGILLTVLFYLALAVVAIIQVVYTYIAMYDLYASCDPNNATTYLVLSILINVTQPFFMFFNRKKDLGMPPRKAEPQPVQEPVLPEAEEIPAEPVCEETSAAEEVPPAEEEITEETE